MRHITKESIETLERRHDFLSQRLKERGEYSGDSYDYAEVEALKTAIWNMKFIHSHPVVERKIRTEESYDEIMNEEI